MFSLRVNGKTYSVDVEPETPLLWVLRDAIGLTGTKFGCGGVHGAREWPGSALVRPVGKPGGRERDNDDRGTLAKRAASPAGSLARR